MSHVDTLGITIYETNESGLITFGAFPDAVPTTANKYAAGCILRGCDGKVYTNAGSSASPSFQDINSVQTSEIADAAVTYPKYNIVEAITATDDGTTTGTISSTTTHATVTSSAGTKVVTLPAPVVGRHLIIDVGANGFKLQSSAPATVAINGGTGESAKSTIAANSTCYMFCVSTTAWKGFFMDADSDVAKVAAAA